jgi:hypothetical protein
MKIIQNLTKENFWNRMMEQYPNATKKFCDWIDEYKVSVNWAILFGAKIKFHDLPYEMQVGIWFSYALSIDNIESYVESIFCDYGWHELNKMVENRFSCDEELILEKANNHE